MKVDVMHSELLKYYFFTLVIAFVCSFFLTPLVKKLAEFCKIVDLPNERKVHTSPTPRWGGVAIYVSFFLAVLFVIFLSGWAASPTQKKIEFFSLRHEKQFLGILVAGTVLFLMGIIDDWKDIPAKIKLLIQISVGLLLYYLFDFKIDQITNPFGGHFNPPPFLELVLTLLWVVGITNAMNLLDGLDGLVAGISAISSLTFFAIAIVHKQYFAALILAALAGSTLGFLRYNFFPASIFMGDSGSQFLGVVWGTVTIIGGLKVPTMTVVIPVLVLGLPILDTLTSMLRRFVKGRPIFQADKEHLHHQLLRLGLSQSQTVILFYILTAFMGILAVLLSRP